MLYYIYKYTYIYMLWARRGKRRGDAPATWRRSNDGEVATRTTICDVLNGAFGEDIIMRRPEDN